jgi:hypothetical protein
MVLPQEFLKVQLFGVVSILTIMMTAPMTTKAGEPPTAERCYDAGYRWI